jgi:hypothetical protein
MPAEPMPAPEAGPHAADKRVAGVDSPPDPWHGARRIRREPGTAARRLGLALITEITVVGGDRYRVDGDAKAVETAILDAARGSFLDLAWMIEAETGERVGFNPEHIVMLRAVTS